MDERGNLTRGPPFLRGAFSCLRLTKTQKQAEKVADLLIWLQQQLKYVRAHRESTSGAQGLGIRGAALWSGTLAQKGGLDMKLKLKLGRFNLELQLDKAVVLALLMLWC